MYKCNNISVIPNGIEKYMSFTTNNNLRSIDSFQFLSFSLDVSVKSLNKGDVNYLSQGLDNNVLDRFKQRRFDPSEYITDFENSKE